jgi:hypothetical protein
MRISSVTDHQTRSTRWQSFAPDGVEALTWMTDFVKYGYSPKNVANDADYIAF